MSLCPICWTRQYLSCIQCLHSHCLSRSKFKIPLPLLSHGFNEITLLRHRGIQSSTNIDTKQTRGQNDLRWYNQRWLGNRDLPQNAHILYQCHMGFNQPRPLRRQEAVLSPFILLGIKWFWSHYGQSFRPIVTKIHIWPIFHKTLIFRTCRHKNGIFQAHKSGENELCSRPVSVSAIHSRKNTKRTRTRRDSDDDTALRQSNVQKTDKVGLVSLFNKLILWKSALSFNRPIFYSLQKFRM